MTRAERTIKALRAPDASLSRVANTVRQSLAEVIEETEARAIKAEEETHYANGVADLAMKHRDEAEARALKAEAECNTCQAGLKASINRFIKAEAALREIMAAFENPATSEDAAGYIMFEIARTALEGK
jgi:ubiquinone biosynthesis protein UbiJ